MRKHLSVLEEADQSASEKYANVGNYISLFTIIGILLIMFAILISMPIIVDYVNRIFTYFGG